MGPVCWEPGGGHHCDRPGHEWPYTCTLGTEYDTDCVWVDPRVGWQPDLCLKAELANVVLDRAHKVAPDPRRPLDMFYNEKTGT